MRLEELRVGDRIKYFEIDRYGNKFEYISHIKTIADLFVTTEHNAVLKKNIISKLEPTKLCAADLSNSPIIYEEIKIQHNYPAYLCPKCYKEWGICFAFEPQVLESKYCPLCNDGFAKKESVKISDLKIGDGVKYKDKIAYCGTTTIEEVHREGKILSIYDKFYQISDEYDKYNSKQLSVKKEDIISKLIPLNEYHNYDPCYKEIPIEKEEWRDESKEKCICCGRKWENKEKSAPKSYRFDFYPTVYNYILRLDYLPTGKTYSIEIKEKEQ